MTSSVLAERVSRSKISDPRPARCSACLQSSDPRVRFVNFDAAINRGAIVDQVSGAVLDSIDELHLCEACVREAAETIDYKPGLHQRHLQLNRQLMMERDQLRRENQTLKQLLAGE
jgi:hypothetical protein